jgi:hypothetical protein
MLRSAGFEVVSATPSPVESRKMRLAVKLTGGRAFEFLSDQWYLLARRPSRAG